MSKLSDKLNQVNADLTQTIKDEHAQVLAAIELLNAKIVELEKAVADSDASGVDQAIEDTKKIVADIQGIYEQA